MATPRLTFARLIESADAVERSWSLSQGGVERRALAFFDATDAAVGLLRDAAEVLGIPAPLVAAWRRALPGADAIGLALRDDLRSVRLYTQYWEAVAARVRAGKVAPAPLYAGFKALPDGSARIDSYICWPGAPRAEFMPEIEGALTAFGADPDGLDEAFRPLTPEACIFTRTRAADRNSWLATLRRAEIPPVSIAAALSGVTDRFATGPEMAESLRSRRLLHVAGGEDAVKGRFLTLYTETDPADLADFIRE